MRSSTPYRDCPSPFLHIQHQPSQAGHLWLLFPLLRLFQKRKCPLYEGWRQPNARMYIKFNDHITQYVLYYMLAVYSLTCDMLTSSSFKGLASFNPERTAYHCLGVNLILTEHFSHRTNRDFRELSCISV